MSKRPFCVLVAVSAVLAMASSVQSAPLPRLPSGSKVFIAPMAGFGGFFRAATERVEIPLVFVATRDQAVYEVTGTTKEVRPEVEGISAVRTTRQHTTMTITQIESGETVFTHSVRTEITSPYSSDRMVDRTTRTPTPSRLLALGKENAARRCAQALQDSMNLKP
jgi:hypothetical protein